MGPPGPLTAAGASQRPALRRTAAVALLFMALAVSCGSGDDDSSGDSTDSDDAASGVLLASSVSEQVDANLAELGLQPERVSCAENLPAAIGSTARCEVIVGGTTYGVTVQVTSTEGDEAVLDVSVDNDPS